MKWLLITSQGMDGASWFRENCDALFMRVLAIGVARREIGRLGNSLLLRNNPTMGIYGDGPCYSVHGYGDGGYHYHRTSEAATAYSDAMDHAGQMKASPDFHEIWVTRLDAGDWKWIVLWKREGTGWTDATPKGSSHIPPAS